MLSMDYKENGVTLEWSDGFRLHAEFLDEVYPDRTCGQWEHGILVQTQGQEDEDSYFISMDNAAVWKMPENEELSDVRCPEVCVMVAVRDAKEEFSYDYDDEGRLVIV